jgi:hypothetical protein
MVVYKRAKALASGPRAEAGAPDEDGITHTSSPLLAGLRALCYRARTMMLLSLALDFTSARPLY